MASLKGGSGHEIRKSLFARGIRQGYLDIEEVENTMPPGLLTASERWLFYFSLRASDVELRDAEGRAVTPEELGATKPEEVEAKPRDSTRSRGRSRR